MESLFSGLRSPAHEYQAVAQDGEGGTEEVAISSSKYVRACAAFSALGGVLFGYDQGVISVVLVMPQFLRRFPMVDDEATGSGFAKGFLTSMILLGAFLGALNQGWIADKISRKRSISLASAIFVVGGLGQTLAMNYGTLVVSRFVGGIGIGMLAMVVPLYISEISPPEIRGRLLVLEEFSIVVGIVVSYYISFFARLMDSEWAWRLPFLLQLFPGCVLGLGILMLPYSPRWLASKGRYEEGLTELSKLRQLPKTNPHVAREWLDIKTEAILQERVFAERHLDLKAMNNFKLEIVSWLDCFRPGCWKRTHVGIGLMFFQQMVGINAIIYYSPSLLKTMGLSYDAQLVMAGVLNIAQLLGVILSFWSMDRFGRRRLLIVGAIAMTACHALISALVARYDGNWRPHHFQAWIAVSGLLVYMIAFGGSWGPVPWAMPAEIFPASLRAKGVALSTCSNWFNNFIVGIITPSLIINAGYGAYSFFMFFCGLAALWVWMFVPETTGRTLEEMDQVFNDSIGAHDEELRADIRAQLENEDEHGAD